MPQDPNESLTVSVVIPTYNRLQLTIAAIESVLGQTTVPSEIIVIDDGSVDGTSVELPRRFGAAIMLIRQENRGQAAATRVGIQKARGDLVTFLDSDDLWLPEKISLQLEVFSRRRDLAGLYTDAEQFSDDSPIRSLFHDHHPLLRNPFNLMEAMIKNHVPARSTFMLRKAFLDSHCILPDPEAIDKDDIQVLMEILGKGGEIAVLDKVTARRRMHSSNISNDHFKRFSRRIMTYRNLLRRCADFDESWKKSVSRALSDSEFYTGEWYWGQGQVRKSREHFSNAINAYFWNWRARLYLIFGLLPQAVVSRLRAILTKARILFSES
jgi:glycosyltransferase involved in cell wall biosynthesis